MLGTPGRWWSSARTKTGGTRGAQLKTFFFCFATIKTATCHNRARNAEPLKHTFRAVVMAELKALEEATAKLTKKLEELDATVRKSASDVSDLSSKWGSVSTMSTMNDGSGVTAAVRYPVGNPMQKGCSGAVIATIVIIVLLILAVMAVAAYFTMRNNFIIESPPAESSGVHRVSLMDKPRLAQVSGQQHQNQTKDTAASAGAVQSGRTNGMSASAPTGGGPHMSTMRPQARLSAPVGASLPTGQNLPQGPRFALRAGPTSTVMAPMRRPNNSTRLLHTGDARQKQASDVTEGRLKEAMSQEITPACADVKNPVFADAGIAMLRKGSNTIANKAIEVAMRVDRGKASVPVGASIPSNLGNYTSASSVDMC